MEYKKKAKRMVPGSDISFDWKRNMQAGNLSWGNVLSDVSVNIEKSGGKLWSKGVRILPDEKPYSSFVGNKRKRNRKNHAKISRRLCKNLQ